MSISRKKLFSPRKSKGDVTVTFLGGLSKIGRNCMVLEYNERCVVIDCGILFPDADMPGIDYILPDLTYLYERKDKIDGVVITHAHEDHAGGLQFLLRHVDVPIYSSRLSLALLSRRLDEAGLLSKADLIEVADGQSVHIGEFEVEFIPVTHSVPHAFAASYTCGAGTIIHTGDFKIDHSPIDGRRTDLARIGEIARTHDVRLLLSDSTGAERHGTTGSESSIGPAFESILHQYSEKRIIVSTFASHIHRMIQVVESAVSHGRKIAFLGRSIHANITAARELGLINFNDRYIIDIESVDDYPPEDVCVICTGSQGEPLSALSLIASGQSKFLAVSEEDCIVLSSHTIPGNETGVNRIINGLMRKGATVIHDDNAPVHVSGHASADELATMISLCEPEYFIPVHGEHRHMKAHADIALRTGLDDEHVFVCHDGDRVTLTNEGCEIEHDATSSAFLYVDGNVGGITNALLRDRRELGSDGLVVVVVTVDEQDGQILGDIEVVTRGWVPRSDVTEYISATQKSVRAALESALEAGERDIEAMKTLVRRAAGEASSDTTGRRPIILPLVLEI